MLRYAVAGGLLAGLYGIVHDQVTYSISPEFFTRLKFLQFHWADLGFPARVFVGEIGFLATSGVGLLSAWFLARITVPALPADLAFRYNVRGFLIVFVCALAAESVGYVLGIVHGSDYSAWQGAGESLQIADLPSFVRVAYIHNSGYLGGLVGLIVAIVYVKSPSPQT